jgi:predicted PurR-regulated permease PerM
MEVDELKETEEMSESADELVVEKVVAVKEQGPPPRHFSIAVMGIFLLGTIAFLYFAKVFFLPLLLAVLLSLLLKPVVKWLARFKVPQRLGAALVLIAVLLGLANGLGQIAKPATDFIGSLPESLRTVEQKIRGLIWHAEQLTKAAAQVEDLAKGKPEERPATKVEVKRFNLADTIFTATASFIAGGIETIVLLYFLLANGELFLQKLVKMLPNFRDKKEVASMSRDVQQNISAFLFTITLINCCLGLVVGLGVWMVGLSNPVLWGVVAAALNYIPYFGPIVGVSILALAGLLSFDSVGRALIPPLIYLTLHTLESNFVTPMVLGRRLTLNPVVIFVSLMFWTWLWGIPGALLSVPVLMTLKILSDHFKPLAPLGEFLSG